MRFKWSGKGYQTTRPPYPEAYYLRNLSYGFVHWEQDPKRTPTQTFSVD